MNVGSLRRRWPNERPLTALLFAAPVLVSLALPTVSWVLARAQTSPKPANRLQVREACPFYPPGTIVPEPENLKSKNGKLTLVLKIRNSIDPVSGAARYCYVDDRGNLAPTLRLRAGDTLILYLKNEISSLPSNSDANRATVHPEIAQRPHAGHDPCKGGAMTPYSTNLHFHGLAIPPVCHQDDTLNTLVQPGDPPFEYYLQIPKDQPPGLYWYHPHVHGFSEEQVLGGASGALIVEGIERASPQVAGLPERVFVIRDARMPGSASAGGRNQNRPTKDLSINYVPVPYPSYPRATIKIRPLERQFWRVLNASADTYLDLQVLFGGTPQYLNLISLDGVPLGYGVRPRGVTPSRTGVFIPPGSRAEFIVTGPPVGVAGVLETSFVNRAADDDRGMRAPMVNVQPGVPMGQDDLDPTRPIASLVPSADEPKDSRTLPSATDDGSLATAPPLSAVQPARKRTLYFSERLVDPSNPNGATLFFLTEEGQTPAVFDPHAKPNITVHVGDVEDWIIENRSLESHAFHIHQLHFLLMGALGVPWDEPALRDTIDLPAWRGLGRYPSVTLRMDFRSPAIVGTFPFHCHILQHSDGGMMGTVRVEPTGRKEENN